MMALPTLRWSWLAPAGAVALLLVGACRDHKGPVEIRDSDASSAELLAALIVSDPGEEIGAARSPGGISAEGIVFLSLPPGSVPDGERIVFRVRTTTAEVTAAIVDGGVDPVPLAATAGDTLDILIELAGGEAPLLFFSVVPPEGPPVIVRTDPPPRKRDVPLDAVMTVVFSEPIDATTITASSVQLSLDGVPVPGTLQFGDAANLTVMLIPAGTLAAGADYSLLITDDVRDLDGDALSGELLIDFRTAAPLAPEGLAIVSGDHQPGKAGRELGAPFVVRVTDANGAGVPDAVVTWTVTSGEGVLDGQWDRCAYSWSRQELWRPRPSTSVRTDGSGQGRLSFIPTWFGPVTVRASIGGSVVTFTTDASDPGATVEVVPGNGDAVTAWAVADFGWARHPPLVVAVRDGDGNPVPYIGVDWQVESGDGAFDWCGWVLPSPVHLRTEGNGSPRSSTGFQPLALGPGVVTATVPALQGAPAVAFEIDATATLILLERVAPGVWAFWGPDGPGHSDVVVPVGTRVDFLVYADAAHIVSTSSPAGGVSFESGMLSWNGQIRYDPVADSLFGFVPNVTGTWTFVDQISGATGTLTARVP